MQTRPQNATPGFPNSRSSEGITADAPSPSECTLEAIVM